MMPRSALLATVIALAAWAATVGAESGPGVGLPLGCVERASLARLDKGNGSYRLVIVPPGRNFEILPVTDGLQQQVFLWNERLAWLPVNAIKRLSFSYQLPADKLQLSPQDVRFEPCRSLPPGVHYC